MNPLKESLKLIQEEVSILALVCNKASQKESFPDLPALDRLVILRFYKSNLVKLTMIDKCSFSFYYSEMISLYKLLSICPLSEDYVNVVRNNLLGKLQKAIAVCPTIRINDSEITIKKY